MLKACAEHALTTCLRGYEKHKSPRADVLQLPGPGLGTAEDRGGEKGLRKTPQKRCIQSHDCFIVPEFLNCRSGRGTLLHRTEAQGKLQSLAERVSHAPSQLVRLELKTRTEQGSQTHSGQREPKTR